MSNDEAVRIADDALDAVPFDDAAPGERARAVVATLDAAGWLHDPAKVAALVTDWRAEGVDLERRFGHDAAEPNSTARGYAEALHACADELGAVLGGAPMAETVSTVHDEGIFLRETRGRSGEWRPLDQLRAAAENALAHVGGERDGYVLVQAEYVESLRDCVRDSWGTDEGATTE